MGVYFYHYQGEMFWAEVSARYAEVNEGYNTAQIYWGESGYVIQLPNGEFGGHYLTADRCID